MSRFVCMLSTLVALSALAIFPAGWYAQISVEASPPSGTYDRTLSVQLSASDPDAKIFYTTKPDAGPMEGAIYTEAISIVESTPLVYFAFTSPTDESPIYREDYVIEYPRTLSLETVEHEVISGDTLQVSIVNTDKSRAVSLRGWSIRFAAEDVFGFQAADGIDANSAHEARVRIDAPGSGLLQLVAPDGTVISSTEIRVCDTRCASDDEGVISTAPDNQDISPQESSVQTEQNPGEETWETDTSWNQDISIKNTDSRPDDETPSWSEVSESAAGELSELAELSDRETPSITASVRESGANGFLIYAVLLFLAALAGTIGSTIGFGGKIFH